MMMKTSPPISISVTSRTRIADSLIPHAVTKPKPTTIRQIISQSGAVIKCSKNPANALASVAAETTPVTITSQPTVAASHFFPKAFSTYWASPALYGNRADNSANENALNSAMTADTRNAQGVSIPAERATSPVSA